MNKKITIIVSSITTAFLLSSCTPKSMPAANHVIYQTGPSVKLGTMHHGGTMHHYEKCQHRHHRHH